MAVAYDKASERMVARLSWGAHCKYLITNVSMLKVLRIDTAVLPTKSLSPFLAFQLSQFMEGLNENDFSLGYATKLKFFTRNENNFLPLRRSPRSQQTSDTLKETLPIQGFGIIQQTLH